MFWNKGESQEKRPPESSPKHDVCASPPQETIELSDDPTVDAVETLAEVLRALGKHAFDLDDISRDDTADECEKWALRLLIGEVPQEPSTVDSTGNRRRRGIKRDWGGVRRFVDKHRRSEHDYVVAGMANLRQAVRVFIQCTTGTFRAERSCDAIITEELDALGRALAINDHAQIRHAAEKTALTLREQLKERQQREQDQIEQLRESMKTLQHELSHLRREVKTDGLTQVYNRAALDEHIEQVADQAFFSDSESCVIMVDIDHFKGVNDAYGHQSGDEVLRQIADTIVRGFFRREDFVARYGGEEFCIVAQHTTFEATHQRAERLRQAVQNLKIQIFGKTLSVSVSFGIAPLTKGETAESCLKRADEALYRAKKKGRNRISIAPQSEGEALGGTGAPLGATLSLRPPSEMPPRTVRTQADSRPAVASNRRPANHNGARSSNPNTKNEPTPAPAANDKKRATAQSKAASSASRRRAEAKAQAQAQAPSSPISALLGPSGRR